MKNIYKQIDEKQASRAAELKELETKQDAAKQAAKEAERKLEDTRLLKSIRSSSQIKMTELLKTLEKPLLYKVLSKKDVVEYVLENGRDEELSLLITELKKG